MERCASTRAAPALRFADGASQANVVSWFNGSLPLERRQEIDATAINWAITVGGCVIRVPLMAVEPIKGRCA